MNLAKTLLLMTLMTVGLVLIGHLLGGQELAIVALIVAGLMNFVMYFLSDKIVLAMYGAREVTRDEAPRLFGIVERLTRNAGMPMPRVYIIPADVPNAFATGRNPSHAAVAVTHGILNLINEEELEGVLAHELAHVRHRDILIATLVATLAGAITYLVQIGVIFGGGNGRDREGGNPIVLLILLILAPIAAMLIQLWISRTREYAADEGGADLCGKPLALASALEKIHNYAQAYPLDANPSTAHLFIVNPLRGGGVWSLFSTHPPVEKRIERLHEIARQI